MKIFSINKKKNINHCAFFSLFSFPDVYHSTEETAFLKSSSILGYYKILSKVPHAIQ